jgi:hypothetical protein
MEQIILAEVEAEVRAQQMEDREDLELLFSAMQTLLQI